MRIRKRRILPATCPSTSWPLSSCTRNIAFGSASTTSPSNSTFSSFAKLDDPDVGRLRALGGLAQLVFDLRALREGAEAVARDAREVHERVLAPVIGGDEPEALLVAEPLHYAGRHCRSLLTGPRGVIPPYGAQPSPCPPGVAPPVPVPVPVPASGDGCGGAS